MRNKNNNDLRIAAIVTAFILLFSIPPQTISGNSEALETKPFEDSKNITFEDKITAKKHIPKSTQASLYIPKPPEITPVASNTFVITGYSQSAEEGTADGITASGKPVSYGICAADTRYYPFGTKFDIPGYGICTVWDTGGAIKGSRIDAFFPTRSQAFAWGTRTLKVEVL